MKDNKYLITLFATSTKGGRDLVRRIESFENCSIRINDSNSEFICKVNVYYPSDPEFNTLHFMRSQKISGFVIFDGSIEEIENGLMGDNYKCVPHAPYMNDNVLIVSRTVLPLNFIPHTTNVLPFGQNIKVDNDGKLSQITSYDNESIVCFIREQVIINTRDKELGTYNQKDSKSSVKKNPQLFLSNGEKIAFISYRSFYNSPNKCGKYSVQDLKEHIINYHKTNNPDEKWKVIFYPPGGLSQDCPTEYLRWALFTYVNNIFRYVDEVWIFDTGSSDEKSYWDSWFTQGEFLSLMEIQQELPNLMPIVHLFDPHKGKSYVLTDFPPIRSAKSSELSLLSANSDILWGDYAALRNVSLFLEEWRNYGFIRKSLWNGFYKSASFIVKLFYHDFKTDDFNKMSKLHAYQPEFFTNRVFSCPNCIKTGYSMESFKDEAFISQFLHIGDKECPVEGYFTLTKTEFGEAIEKGYVECPSCHRRIYIKRNPNQDFYLWKKWTKRTNPNGEWYIEKIPAYSVQDGKLN